MQTTSGTFSLTEPDRSKVVSYVVGANYGFKVEKGTETESLVLMISGKHQVDHHGLNRGEIQSINQDVSENR